MYFKFAFLFVLFLLEHFSATILFDDDQPFVTTKDKSAENNNETVEVKLMLFPSLGFEKLDQPGKYKLMIYGWCYEPMPLSSKNYKAFSKAFEVTLLGADRKEDFSKKEKQERIAPFFVHNLKNYNLRIDLSETMHQDVSTGDDGLFQKTIFVDALDELTIDDNRHLEYTATDETDQILGKGSVYLMDNQDGCSIISDIDDTIKVSEVAYPNKFVVNIFKKDYKAVPGMSDVYRLWQSSHQCLFHYVSPMPLQFYYVTQKFIEEKNFPQGSFHMRDLKIASKISITSVQNLVNNIQNSGAQKHKTDRITEIIEGSAPSRQFILVGDSAEDDPETYGALARDHPGKVHKIFIRLVSGGKNDDQRFEKAFVDIEKERWFRFTKADELPKELFPNEDSKADENDSDTDDDANGQHKPSSSNHAHILSFFFLYTPFQFYFLFKTFLYSIFFCIYTRRQS